jgi:hypothetical protein
MQSLEDDEQPEEEGLSGEERCLFNLFENTYDDEED